METETVRQKTESNLVALAKRVDELISLCEQQAQENQSLRAQQTALLAERDELTQKSEQLRARIEVMVARLKGLEQSS